MPEAPAVPGPALASMAQQFAGLPMPALIGGPLMAACSANQQMALTQIDFLMKTCFVEGDDSADKGKSYAPVMVNMTLTQGIIVPPAEGSDCFRCFRWRRPPPAPASSFGLRAPAASG